MSRSSPATCARASMACRLSPHGTLGPEPQSALALQREPARLTTELSFAIPSRVVVLCWSGCLNPKVGSLSRLARESRSLPALPDREAVTGHPAGPHSGSKLLAAPQPMVFSGPGIPNRRVPPSKNPPRQDRGKPDNSGHPGGSDQRGIGAEHAVEGVPVVR
jgi:hypothetical protein